ncbi:thioredoxin H-type 2-like [Cicer arietinum]|uniref:Thioredoxin H2-like n=1 Tax=Cicer arietinum TaxID=3827 RepID=A0A1S2XIQ9_CICAR|nr:thioredoxin H2-like [Cicer arietinum]
MGGNLSNMEYVHTSSAKSSSNILTFNSTAKWKVHLKASEQTNKLMVVEFTATWCAPCKYMDPIIQEFATKYKNIVDFIKIDVDVLMDVTQEYQVQAMPTFILMKKGEVVDKVVGAKKDELTMLIEKHKN